MKLIIAEIVFAAGTGLLCCELFYLADANLFISFAVTGVLGNQASWVARHFFKGRKVDV